MKSAKLLVMMAIVSTCLLAVILLGPGNRGSVSAVGTPPQRLLFQDNFQRGNSNWVGGGWREYTRRNDQVQAADSPWQIRNGVLYFEATGTNSYVEDFIETAATFPVDNVRVDFELRARVATSRGYVGPTAF